MILDPHVARVQDDLRAAAALGGSDLQHAVDHLATALDASMRLAITDALSVASAELSAAIAPNSVSVQLDAAGPQLVAQLDEPLGSADPAAAGGDPELLDELQEGDDELSRISLRINAGLKRHVEAAAAQDDVSVNTFISRALVHTLRMGGTHGRGGPHFGPMHGHPGSNSRGRMHGWAF